MTNFTWGQEKVTNRHFEIGRGGGPGEEVIRTLPQFPTFSKWRLYWDVLLGEFERSLWRKALL